ncbi:MAG TPA: aminotransferase class I/II-fold pyridoxal phosphate-dependent enzyme [Dokdonella sp.]|uniref:trans-sulfuration enzyme family protein n=1 Tax=Dokdonella sp. TaxID=2291710 RepID=UPI002D807A73|nr:aminotransferase class I/II-fold pyridoxal phosphate-dependent enzyme [Dokdonella sp.]HET9031718.1 aminotransferase class I/II-fold pyridoxal phosphate-dependent enzyme [Dokdonella sp.]
MRFETLAVHAGGESDPATGALSPPIHLATTFKHGPAAERLDGYEYQREGNPTNDRLCAALAALEHGQSALTFASGMAAISGLLESLNPGSHIVIPDDCYTGLRILAGEFLPDRGVRVSTIDVTDIDALRQACNGGIDLVWVETPSNPRMKITDIRAVAEISHAHGGRVVCDNTFASPALQRPLDLGADIVMHSTTKYFGGHSDVLGGALIFKEAGEWFEQAAHRLHITGATLAPFSAWLTLRGCRSLPARMNMHCSNARAIAEFLDKHSSIERVNYPGLPSHPGHAVAASQMSDFGGMLSIELRGGKSAALAMAGKLKLFTNATSLGGCESLIEHRASVEGENPTSTENLLRISVGLEHHEDLIADLVQALD